MRIRFWKIYKEAEREIYELIDKNIRKLLKDEDGSFVVTEDYHNNDVDALRHAYVSGVYVLEYSNAFSNFLGIIQERIPFFGGSNETRPLEDNMDLWNNYIGRMYALKSSDRLELFKFLLQALRNGELITNLLDPRRFQFFKRPKINIKGTVLVMTESQTGENLIFYDPSENIEMSKIEFVSKIKEGFYSFYSVKVINGKETPVSKRDGKMINNLD